MSKIGLGLSPLDHAAQARLREILAKLSEHGRILPVVDQPAPIGALPVAVARAAGAEVGYLPGLAMRRIADLRPGHAKTEARDAAIIAEAARTMPHTLRSVALDDETLAELLRQSDTQARRGIVSGLRHEVNRRVAELLAASLDRTGNLVTSNVPPGYERYVRVLNPIESGDGSVVAWSDAVERNGLKPSPWMQWGELKAHLGVSLAPNNAEPAMGDPPRNLARALIRELRADDDRYYFASWIGYAEASSQATIEFSPPRREMTLYSGFLVDETGSAVVPVTDTGRVPMYWWPKDLRWCVGQDLYARSLIVGCDLATAGRILAAPDLDSYLIRGSDSVLSEDF